MGTVTAPPSEPQNIGRAYTKRQRWALELRYFVPFIGIISYCLLGLHQASALLAKATTSNFYLQVALCWIPVWIICTAASLLVSCYSFYLDRKFGLVKSDLRTWLRDSLKANTLALVLGVWSWRLPLPRIHCPLCTDGYGRGYYVRFCSWESRGCYLGSYPCSTR